MVARASDFAQQALVYCSSRQWAARSDCYRLTDDAVELLATHCCSLRKAALSRCHNVTVAAMRRLAGIKTLRAIDLFGCYTDVFPTIQVCNPPSEAASLLLWLWSASGSGAHGVVLALLCSRMCAAISPSIRILSVQ
jgi:hypothetical protein